MPVPTMCRCGIHFQSTFRVDVDLFSKKARLVGPFKKVRTREEVDFQWARAAVSAGLPMSFFDKRRFGRPS